MKIVDKQTDPESRVDVVETWINNSFPICQLLSFFLLTGFFFFLKTLCLSLYLLIENWSSVDDQLSSIVNEVDLK